MVTTNSYNEQQAALAFGKQSAVFDELYSGNTIIQYKRERVRSHLYDLLAPDSNILELNAGTGEDAMWFAQQGHTVHATDISEGMQKVAREKITSAGLEDNVSFELCSFTQLQNLQNKGPYDAIFSNFAGLNCTGELNKVLASFKKLLKPGGTVTLVILPKFCLWESLLLFKGKFKTATRRLFAKNGRNSRVEGEHFKCWYYNPSYVINKLKNDFELVKLEGLCTFVPPSYIEGFAEKYPKLYRKMKTLEEKKRSAWPWRCIGDYYIISLRSEFTPSEVEGR
ncbi:MAG TPA: class I SAM-dependent methyltransferase [Chitinophagaceae bacterium]|nr:class I SAM-dependent methyltransferase [Chitinophagaceae bacterium]